MTKTQWDLKTYVSVQNGSKNNVPDDSEEIILPIQRGRKNHRRLYLYLASMLLTAILLLTWTLFLVVDTKANRYINRCNADACRFNLVETIPIGMDYPSSAVLHNSTHSAWMDLIAKAESSIEIASFYWTMLGEDVVPDESAQFGEEVFQALIDAGTKRRIPVHIVRSAPQPKDKDKDVQLLLKAKAATVLTVNFTRLFGGGVLHTKLWLIDRKRVYIGSANMDWRALTQVKEMGILIDDCPCIGTDIGKIFDVYWSLGLTHKVPSAWPANLATDFNADTPMKSNDFSVYFSSSPQPLLPTGRTFDLDAILNTIKVSKKFIYIAVMDYFPMSIYGKERYWPDVDDALRTAAINRKVEVRLLISWWKHSNKAMENFLQSLAALNSVYKHVRIEVKRFVVNADEHQRKIPFTRVNHNKYMVTDNTAYIGTSNWSQDYFTDTAGVGFVMRDPQSGTDNNDTIRAQLQAVFERDWESVYAKPLWEN